MADLTDTVDNSAPERGSPIEGARAEGPVHRLQGRVLLTLGALLSVVMVGAVAWLAIGGDDAGPADALTDALPISDESVGPAVVPAAPPTSPEPLVEVEEPPLVGEPVATAKITEGEVEIWASPDDAEPTWRLPVPTEFWGDRHFLVIDEIDGWYKILVPVRPNESEGWIPADDVTLSATNFRVQISVSDRSVKVWEGDDLVIDTTGAVGRDNAPTPLGNFYIRDVLPWDENSAYGPYVLALSAYSEVIDEINGGEAVVAIHGTSRPELIGRAVSLGCIRLHNDDITMIAETVPVGTPVEIVA